MSIEHTFYRQEIQIFQLITNPSKYKLSFNIIKIIILLSFKSKLLEDYYELCIHYWITCSECGNTLPSHLTIPTKFVGKFFTTFPSFLLGKQWNHSNIRLTILSEHSMWSQNIWILVGGVKFLLFIFLSFEQEDEKIISALKLKYYFTTDAKIRSQYSILLFHTLFPLADEQK